jgi:DNA-binding transcriptional ArsR family regulator
MFYFNFGGFQVVGASPEILVRLRDGEVTIRPIAGTRKRGSTPEEDKALEADLLSDPNRLEILLCLHRVPGICVGDLATAVGRSENSVSQALRILRQQGWVKSTRIGRQASYRLDDPIVHDLLHWIGAAHS